MHIDERIEVQMGATVSKSNARSKTNWAKRAARNAIWEIRKKIIKEQGLDIFNVFVYSDRIEVSVCGELDATFKGEGKYFAKRR